MLPLRILEPALITIENTCGISLKWNETIALSNYIENFQLKHKEEKIRYGDASFNAYTESIIKFLEEYFGIDWHDLDRKQIYTSHKKFEFYGFGLLGTEPFKQYCKDHIQQWRDERELI